MNNSQPVRVWPLGGLGEIGMNCLAIEQGGDVLLVDCGVTFDRRGLGIDIIHPAFDSLEAYSGRIAGLFITHGHEDHIGAIPYLMRRFDVPVWGPRYAMRLLEERSSEHPILKYGRFTDVTPGERYGVGPFEVEPIRVTHSIADSTALAIQTAAGVVVHTGDFKFDESPPDGELFDVDRLRTLGDEGVALLFSDSTNSDSYGMTGSEADVGEVLEPIIEAAEGAVVIAMFASNVHRLRLLGDIAQRTNRTLVPLGRSVRTHAKIAKSTGYLDWPKERVLPVERVRELPRKGILGIATGTQAETNAALARLARGVYPGFQLKSGDTVVFSSRIIPGHEPQVYDLIGELLRQGIKVRSRMSDRGVHVSGHAYRGDQRQMLDLVRPQSFVPVHGTIHHMQRHAEMAREAKVPCVLVLENGEVGELNAHEIKKRERVPTGRVHVRAGREITHATVNERIALAAEGAVQLVVVLKKDPLALIELKIHSVGVMTRDEAAEWLPGVRREARSALVDVLTSHHDMLSDDEVLDPARRAIRRVLAKTLGYKPGVFGVVVRL